MSAVFLDTVGLLAQWDRTDQWHEPARQVYQTMLASHRPLVTSAYVLLECGNAASRRPFRSAVARFRQEMQAGGRIIFPTEDDWQAAWTTYARGDATEPGIVDQISFVVMHRLGITDAFSNDQHFKSAGFNTLF